MLLKENASVVSLSVQDLTILKNQLDYECMMHHKLQHFASFCIDPQLKNICQESSKIHSQNFHDLLHYLNDYCS